MAKKKPSHIHISQEDNTQAQQILERYHEIANKLHSSTDQEQAESALAEISTMPESAQMALLKLLAKQRDTDAADILLALNELSPIKGIRKEARRVLIQLEGARISPKWNPPLKKLSAIQLTSNPPRFWKGAVTNTFGSGEVQMILCWEMGEDYSQARMLGFLLEFWHDGVKDFFTEVASKRHIETHLTEMKTSLADIEVSDCTLAEGRRLLLDALEINKRFGTPIAKDYRLNLPLIKQLILDATDLGEDRGQSFINRNMQPDTVVVNFVESLVSGDYGFAYDLLTKDSSIRNGLTRQEWIDRHEAWAKEADPESFKPEFIHELEQKHSGIWLPNPFSANRSSTRKVFDTGWSLAMTDTPLNETIPELPRASAIYGETERHWFWTSYTLVQEEDAWRISTMTDEGANARQFSVEELQKRISENNDILENITKKHQPTDADADKYLNQILWRSGQTSHYFDALLEKLPLDRSIYDEALALPLAFSDYERALVYLEPRAERFGEGQAQALLQLAAAQMQLAEQFFQDADDELYEDFQKLAEASLRKALSIDNSATGHLLLAELLKDDNDRLDEAEDHLNQAQALTTDENIHASIEHNLGELDFERDQFDSALRHYQRMVEIQPGNADAWFHIGETHSVLGNYEEAEANYRRSIGLAPEDPESYTALSQMLIDNGEPVKAREVLEEGLRFNPDSPELRVHLSLVLSSLGDYTRAQAMLDEAEDLDPDLEMLKVYRQILNLNRIQQLPKPGVVDAFPTGTKPKQLPKAKKHKKR